MITNQQYKRLMSKYKHTGKILVSALKAEVDRHTARKYVEAGKCPAELQAPHTWRTRPDPLDKIWGEVSAMLGDAPELEAKTLFEYFLARPESGLEEAHLRTFYRRVRHWRATQGPEREVFFARERKPGELMQLDWTYAQELRVTIQGQELDHLFCHCVLPYSDWQWATRCVSESFLSLVAGLQAALGQLGKSTPHLLLRGSRDFAAVEDYDLFVQGVLRAANAKRQKRLAQELAGMRPVPASPLAQYREYAPVVSSQSLIRVKRHTYSVPSRLIGHTLRVELHEAQLKVYLGGEFLFCLPRLRGDRGALVDFRHVITGRLRKPGAFIQYRHREALYPSAVFRAAFDRLVAEHGERPGVIEYLHVLKLAAEETVEKVEPLLRVQLAQPGKWRATQVRDRVAPVARKLIELASLTPSLQAYDTLLESEVAHVG
jgi:hypothetical protein